jgi:serine/threonine protein kinase
MFMGEVATKSSDTYAFGVLLWELATSELPYEDCSIRQIAQVNLITSSPSLLPPPPHHNHHCHRRFTIVTIILTTITITIYSPSIVGSGEHTPPERE